MNMDELIVDFAMYCRSKVVETLMAGNDTQCFTTEQYRLMYIKIIDKDTPSILNVKERSDRVVQQHLESLIKIGKIEEVTPGIWRGK